MGLIIPERYGDGLGKLCRYHHLWRGPCLANVQIVRPRHGDNGPPANVNGRPEIYTHNHYNIPTNHNVHINHIHIIHENIKMLALGTEAYI
jgi:hypothetical protein